MNNADLHRLRRLENLKETVGASFMLTLMLAVVGAAFYALHEFLVRHGLSSGLLSSASVWVGIGVACSLVWPLRYWEGMKGHWVSYWPSLPLLAMTGPFALLLGFPV